MFALAVVNARFVLLPVFLSLGVLLLVFFFILQM